jgi:iron complex outermembrane receptor protein
VDAYITYEHSASGLSVKLWGDNLTDEDYPKSIYNIGPGQIAAFGNPRSYGITLEKRF